MPQPGWTEAQGLEEAFRSFNQLSEQLTASYQQLEQRVAGLNDELAAARDARIRELTEKERLANRLELLLKVLPGGIVVLDGQGQVQECNPAAVELLGEPLLDQFWTDIIQRAFAPRNDDGHEVSLADGRRVSISTCPLGSEPGQILLITDVTEMRRLQDRLGQQQRLAAMGETAASLAHQIRTPLASALLYAGNLKQQQMTDKDRLRVGEKIFDRLRHLEHLVNNMLMYARDNSSGVETFAAAELLAELERALESQFQATATEFNWHDETAGLQLQANRQMLLSGLINLCMNAMQAMGRTGHLEVLACRLNEQQLEIRVMDDGPGIPESQQAQVFNPFFTTRKEGTGLGLAVVAAIAKSHQGEVELQSVPGEGCTFILRLPAQPASQDTGAGVGESSNEGAVVRQAG